MKIAEIIAQGIRTALACNDAGDIPEVTAGKILALIPANMEVPALEDCAGPLSIERRNLILGRNAGLSEVRKAMGVKNDR